MKRSIAVLALAFVYAAAVPPAADTAVTYLRDHAADAVKWQPWGKGALDQARQQQKPIALVIGSFAPHSSRTAHAAIELDPVIVNLLNGSFVPILLDRAEYPWIAAAYAAASGRADGRDIIIHVLTPDLEWLDSIPAEEGVKSRLQDASRKWAADRDAFLDASRLAVRRVRLHSGDAAPASAGAPDRDALVALERGALHDVLGGGFFRAVRGDGTPFFDKTLDDQARLAALFLDASQILPEPRFADVARETLEYAVRDLQMRNGGFNDSQQSDSLVPLGKPVIADGAFYLWDRAELLHVFGPKMGAQLIERFGIAPEGKSVPRMAQTDAPDAETAAAIAKMLDIRLKRPAPRRDEPVASSHARMVSALARGGMVLGDERFVRAAVAGGQYLERTLYDRQTKRLSRRPRVPADAEDYVAVVAAFVDLYEATLEPKWLDLALELQSQQDSAGVRPVPEPVRDFVTTPAALAPLNAASNFNRIRLAAITGRDDLWRRTETKPVTRVIIFGRTGRADTAALLQAAYTSFEPLRVIVHGGEAKRPTPRNVAIGSLRPLDDGTASAFVCRAAGCSQAFTDPRAVAGTLR